MCVFDILPRNTKKMHVKLIGVSKLPLGVSVGVCGCLSITGLAMDWMDSRVYPDFHLKRAGKGFNKSWLPLMGLIDKLIEPIIYSPWYMKHYEIFTLPMPWPFFATK